MGTSDGDGNVEHVSLACLRVLSKAFVPDPIDLHDAVAIYDRRSVITNGPKSPARSHFWTATCLRAPLR